MHQTPLRAAHTSPRYPSELRHLGWQSVRLTKTFFLRVSVYCLCRWVVQLCIAEVPFFRPRPFTVTNVIDIPV
jgi:hypothetical protein